LDGGPLRPGSPVSVMTFYLVSAVVVAPGRAGAMATWAGLPAPRAPSAAAGRGWDRSGDSGRRPAWHRGAADWSGHGRLPPPLGLTGLHPHGRSARLSSSRSRAWRRVGVLC